MQNEIKIKDDLLDNNGLLKHKGYAKDLLLNYNPQNVKISSFGFINRLRLKEWDYYGIINNDFFFSITVSNIGYAGLVFVYFIDFNKKEIVEETILRPFGKDCNLPLSSKVGDVNFKYKNTEVSFIRKENQRLIKVKWDSFNKGEGIFADLLIDQPQNIESITMVTPIGSNRFYYNQKINAMPVQGIVKKGSQSFNIDSNNYKSLCTLDWGRGVWEYNSFWIWASTSGYLQDGSTFGLNLGKGFGDLTYASENAFFINGKMNKLGYLDVNYNPKNFMQDWVFNTDCKRLSLTFTPIFERIARTNFLIIQSEVHQMFGRYNGTVKDDNGKEIIISNIMGWAEEHYAKW